MVNIVQYSACVTYQSTTAIHSSSVFSCNGRRFSSSSAVVSAAIGAGLGAVVALVYVEVMFAGSSGSSGR